MASSYPIVGGPNKFDLMVSLLHGRSTNRNTVVFKVQCHKDDVAVAINNLTREDGSGESWIFSGFIIGNKSGQVVSGYYRTDRRIGQIHMEAD
jgi:hypothetical protein